MDTIVSTDEARQGQPPGYQVLGEATLVAREGTGIRLQAEATTVEVTALAADLFRVGLFPHGRVVDYTSMAALPLMHPVGEVQVLEEGKQLIIQTPIASACIDLHPFRIHFRDREGRVFAADDPDLGMGVFTDPVTDMQLLNPVGTLGTPLRVYKQHLANELYYGCGERTGHLNKTDTHQLFWNVDPPPGHTVLQNNLYVSIPFTLVHAPGLTWGIFVDNPGKVEFDLAHERGDRSWFEVNNGDLVYYIFTGPTPQAILERYTELTGRTPMPPLWSLGNGQSRYSYETAEELRTLARTFRERDIPCDTLYLDIDALDGYRDFTWDRERFPDPEGLFAELREQGFHVVVIVDAGIKVDEQYPVYRDGRARKFFCQTQRGTEYQNVVWPGLSVFPDFTSETVRHWWGEQHRVLLDAGIAGIWSDMNEPALFQPLNSTMPDEVVHPGDGRARYHQQIHNAYGSLLVQGTREGLLRSRPEQRPFVISRAGYAGIQRHAMVWTGDNTAAWEHLAMSIPQLQNLSMSGVSWCGVDVGGFYGDTTGELLVRWLELGIFQAFCRNHSEKHTRHQEPWVFGEPYETLSRKMLKLRQRLLPYLYTLFEESHRTGAPLLRPLFWATPEDETTYTVEDQLLCGDTLLLAPIVQPGTTYRHVYLPAGTWFHYWSGEKIEGPKHLLAHAPLGEPALYIRANTALPLWPEMNYVDLDAVIDLTLQVYPALGEGSSHLYEDAGDGYDHLAGVFARRTITTRLTEELLTITIGAQEGSFQPPYKQIRLEVYALPQKPQEIISGGQSVAWMYHEAQKQLVFELPVRAEQQEVKIIL